MSLITPTSDDGAVLFSLTGPGIRDALTASSNYNVYWRSVSATELRLLVVGNLVNGNIATVTVDDVRRLTQYDAAVLEVSSRDDAIRSSLTGYGIRLSR